MIDIHTHILPGLDDGAEDLDQALAMAEVAVKDGITILAATPHVISGVFDNRKSHILEAVKDLNQLLYNKNIPLQILLGAEYHLEPDLPHRLADGELLTINDSGRYLMVELPAMIVPDYTGRILYDMQLQGITPIIAHPERNIGFTREPELLQDFVARGILTQITAGSIIGMFGRPAKMNALRFLKEGIVHLIASDAHSDHGRPPILSLACIELERMGGADYAQTLTYENPRRIIKGLPVEPCIPPKKEALWTKYLKKSR